MANDWSVETLCSFAQAARKYDVSISTVYRWRNRGIKGFRLASLRVGGQRRTSFEALARFHAAVTAASESVAEPVEPAKLHPRTLSPVELADLATVNAQLDAWGF